MTWLEQASSEFPRRLLSPTKAIALAKALPKGVVTYRPEKHSRFSTLGGYRALKPLVDNCGLSHEEQYSAREFPNRRAVSSKPLGTVKRFEGIDTHFKKTSSSTVESCGLTHDELKNACEMPSRRAISSKAETNLGGKELRFAGINSHFRRAQGADMLLGQPKTQSAASSVTIGKSDWKKNSWIVSGTALEDREMLQCDAIIAPTYQIHADIENKGYIPNMSLDSCSRFTYQKPTEAANLEYYSSNDFLQSPSKKNRGQITWRQEKHSRFSTFGSHFKNH